MNSDEFQTLKQQLNELSARVDALEQSCNDAEASSTPMSDPALTRPLFPRPEASLPNYTTPPPSVRQVDLLDRKAEPTATPRGSGWMLGAVALLCFILAAGYLIELAISTGWLTPARQLGAAVFFGFSLVAAGYFLRTKDSEYASYLPGAGIVVLYMSAYGGHLVYSLYSNVVATILAATISFFCIYLFKIFKQDFFVISATVGSYLTPLIIGGQPDSILTVCYYFLFWNLTFCVLSVFLQRRLFIGLASYLAFTVFFAICNKHVFRWGGGIELHAAIFQALQFAMFLSAIAWYSIRNKAPLTAAEAWRLSPALALFYLLEYPLIYRLNSDFAPWVSLLFAGAVYLIYVWARRLLGKQQLESYPVVISFIALVCFHSLYLNILPRGFLPWLALGLLAAIPLLDKKGVSFSKFPLVIGTLFAVVGLEYLRAFNIGVTASHGIANVFVNAGFATLIIVSYLQQNTSAKADSSLLLLLLAHAQAMMGLRTLADILMPHSMFEIVCSSAWGLMALLILLAARPLHDKTLARSALAIFAIVSIKVLFFDLSSRGTLMQVGLLIVVGALFYAGGYVLRQIDSWTPQNESSRRLKI